MYPKLNTKNIELRRDNWFRHHVGQHVLCKLLFEIELITLKILSYKAVANVDMIFALMKFWILGLRNRNLIVLFRDRLIDSHFATLT